MPAAGHVIHMPSHIYQRVGRYADSMKSNQLAIAADEDYLAHRHAQGMYPMMYTPITFTFSGSRRRGMGKARLQSNRHGKRPAR